MFYLSEIRVNFIYDRSLQAGKLGANYNTLVLPITLTYVIIF